MFRDPGLPLRLTKCDEQEVRPRRTDPIQQRSVLLDGELAERRRVRAHDTEIGKTPRQLSSGVLGHTCSSPQQVDPETVLRRPTAEAEDQVRACDPPGERGPLPSRGPDQ